MRLFSFLIFSLAVIGMQAFDALEYVDTRVGTAASETKAAGTFGKKTEEFGQVILAVLAPRGMNFWTPQTRDTELKCVRLIIMPTLCFRDSGIRTGLWADARRTMAR